MSGPLRVWTRREIEELADKEPESVSYIRIRISVRFMKLLIDFANEHGQEIEIISAHGTPGGDAELHFFRRDL